MKTRDALPSGRSQTMPKALMTDFWRDTLAIVSGVVTLVGFLIAWQQIRKTRKAAVAAQTAAAEAVQESRRSFEKYALSNVIRFAAEAAIYLERGQWDQAAIRLGDLAHHAVQLGARDPRWKELSQEIRAWEHTARKLAAGKTRFAAGKWAEFSIKLQERIDTHHGPFQAESSGGAE